MQGIGTDKIPEKYSEEDFTEIIFFECKECRQKSPFGIDHIVHDGECSKSTKTLLEKLESFGELYSFPPNVVEPVGHNKNKDMHYMGKCVTKEVMKLVKEIDDCIHKWKMVGSMVEGGSRIQETYECSLCGKDLIVACDRKRDYCDNKYCTSILDD